jgi:putative heme iron utilization protein
MIDARIAPISACKGRFAAIKSREIEYIMRDRADFDPIWTARRLLFESRSATLATLLPDGAPFASLVTVATGPDAAPILLLSGLARHTGNVLADPRVSLLVAGPSDGDPLESGRLSLTGVLARSDEPTSRRRFIARHPSASEYAQFTDFAFWRMEVAGAHLVAGFGRIVGLAPANLANNVDDAGALIAAEEGALAHMNEDHQDTIELYATRLLGDVPGAWRMVGIDPAGCELLLGRTVRRLDFPHRVTTPDALRKTLVDLAEKARSE